MRIRENPAGDEDAIAATATALVFDVDSQTLYVLASLYFIAGFYDHCSTQFQQKINAYEKQENDIKSKDRVRYAGDLVQLVQVGRDAAEYEVTTFKIDPSVCWKASRKHDFGIFKIPLDASWDCSIRGQAERLEVPPLETPSTRSNPKRKAAELAQPSRPLAVQRCRTPSFRFDVQATETVHMFGFPAAAGCRYVASPWTRCDATIYCCKVFRQKGFLVGLWSPPRLAKLWAFWGARSRAIPRCLPLPTRSTSFLLVLPKWLGSQSQFGSEFQKEAGNSLGKKCFDLFSPFPVGPKTNRALPST